VKVVISTDAHRVAELDYQHYGVEQARRAWLRKSDILNALPLPRFLAALQQLRRGRQA
jgi:DNA polymerase (family 10)